MVLTSKSFLVKFKHECLRQVNRIDEIYSNIDSKGSKNSKASQLSEFRNGLINPDKMLCEDTNKTEVNGNIGHTHTENATEVADPDLHSSFASLLGYIHDNPGFSSIFNASLIAGALWILQQVIHSLVLHSLVHYNIFLVDG